MERLFHEEKKSIEKRLFNPCKIIENPDAIIQQMNTRLIEFLKGKQILYYIQFGFRKDFSTNHVILTLLEIMQKALNDRQYACRIFIDLGKAFDTLSHGILLEKLNRCGMRGIPNDCFRFYVTELSLSLLMVLTLITRL